MLSIRNLGPLLRRRAGASQRQPGGDAGQIVAIVGANGAANPRSSAPLPALKFRAPAASFSRTGRSAAWNRM